MTFDHPLILVEPGGNVAERKIVDRTGESVKSSGIFLLGASAGRLAATSQVFGLRPQFVDRTLQSVPPNFDDIPSHEVKAWQNQQQHPN